MSDLIVNVTAQNWDSEVQAASASLPVLVDFWAEWCRPCLAIAPILEQIAREQSGRLKVAKVNVDVAPDLAQRFNIRSIPTLLIFKNGTVVGQMVGAMPKAALESRIQQFL